MKNNSMLSVKAMIDLYVRYGVEDSTWDMLYNMVCHGLISSDNWTKFYNTCKDWECVGSAIIDCDGKVLYVPDAAGYWTKVA